MQKKISPHSTISSAYSKLVHKRDYVAGVLHKMRQCLKANNNAHVRIGVTGSGQKPYYLIFTLSDVQEETIFGSFYDNHDPLESAFALTSNWSSASMSFEELEDFFAKMTGYTGMRPKI